MSDLPTNSFKIKLCDVEKYNTKLTIKLPMIYGLYIINIFGWFWYKSIFNSWKKSAKHDKLS